MCRLYTNRHAYINLALAISNSIQGAKQGLKLMKNNHGSKQDGNFVIKVTVWMASSCIYIKAVFVD